MKKKRLKKNKKQNKTKNKHSIYQTTHKSLYSAAAFKNSKITSGRYIDVGPIYVRVCIQNIDLYYIPTGR